MLDGSDRVDNVIKQAIPWDAMGGVARRAWARNENSIETSIAYNEKRAGSDHITLPFLADAGMIAELVSETFENIKK